MDENLMAAYKEFDKSNKAIRSPLLFSSGASVNNCDSYMKLISRGEIVEAVNNKLVKSEYLVCDALRVLSQAARFTGKIDTESVGLRLLDNLDLRYFPNSLGRLADEDSFTLKALFPKNSVANEATVTLDTADWMLTIKVVAVVLANNNTTEDWVIQLADESKSGNYRSYETLLIYDPVLSDVLKAERIPEY